MLAEIQEINGRKFHEETEGDRKVEYLPIGETGWDWHMYADKIYSTRWVTNGTIIRCTNCGYETTNSRSTSGHNQLHDRA